MRKLLLLALLVPALLASCSDNSVDPIQEEGKGALALKPGVDKKEIHKEDSRATPTDDFSTWSVFLNGEKMGFPSTGLIEELEPDTYTVKVTSHGNGFTAPAFDTQVYEGSTSVAVKAGQTAEAKVTCKQVNAGVFFVYDASLADIGLSDLVPTVTHTEGALEYSGANRENKGYFNTGVVTVTVKQGGTEKNFSDGPKTLTLGAAELWKVTLKAATSTTGDITLTVDVEEINEPNKFAEWELSVEPPTTVTLPVGGASITGFLTTNDQVRLYLNTTGVTATWNNGFTGTGEGIFFHLNTPKTGKAVLPTGSYTANAAGGDFTYIPGTVTDNVVTIGSYVYRNDGTTTTYTAIDNATLTIDPGFKISAEVTVNGAKRIYEFDGAIEVADPLGVVTHEMPAIFASYYGKHPTYTTSDNIRIHLCDEGVTGSMGAIGGTGRAVFLDLYYPTNGLGKLPAAMYSVVGNGGYQGDYRCDPTASQIMTLKDGVITSTLGLKAGMVTVKVTGDTYTIELMAQGSDDLTKKFKYTGPITLDDPLGLIPRESEFLSAKTYLFNSQWDGYTGFRILLSNPPVSVDAYTPDQTNGVFSGYAGGMGLSIHLCFPTGTTEPTVGTYSINDSFNSLPCAYYSPSPGYLPGSYEYNGTEGSARGIVPGGTVKVGKKGEDYTILLIGENNRGEALNYYYEGPLNITDIR